MTQKEIQALQLSMSEEGFALCKQSKTGAMLPVRKFSNQEVMTMLSMMYAKHITEHPEDPIMMLPLDTEGHALVVTFATPTTQEVKE